MPGMTDRKHRCQECAREFTEDLMTQGGDTWGKGDNDWFCIPCDEKLIEEDRIEEERKNREYFDMIGF